jgi:hypothetical protein
MTGSDGEASIMGWTWPTNGCSATETKKKLFFCLKACPFPFVNATGKPKIKRKGKVQVLMACGKAQVFFCGGEEGVCG